MGFPCGSSGKESACNADWSLDWEDPLEGLMLKLEFQYFGHLMWRTDSFEKTLMLGKNEGGKRRGWQRMNGGMASPTQSWSLSKLRELAMDREAWIAVVHEVPKGWAQLSDWTKTRVETTPTNTEYHKDDTEENNTETQKHNPYRHILRK